MVFMYGKFLPGGEWGEKQRVEERRNAKKAVKAWWMCALLSSTCSYLSLSLSRSLCVSVSRAEEPASVCVCVCECEFWFANIEVVLTRVWIYLTIFGDVDRYFPLSSLFLFYLMTPLRVIFVFSFQDISSTSTW